MDTQANANFVLVHGHGPDAVTENGSPIRHQPRRIISQIQKWLQPTDYTSDSSEFRKHLRLRAAETGQWLQQTEAFHKWYTDMNTGFLWIKGIPGSGKSVFAATIANELATTENVPVLYFFFRQNIMHNHGPRSLIQDWLCQFLNQDPILQLKFKKFLDAERVLDSFSTEELWALLSDALLSVPKVYCIVDALDEMDIGKETFLDNLIELGSRSPSSIKVMVTSRPMPRIEAKLKLNSVLSIRLDRGQVDLDIGKYVKDQLARTELFDLSDEAEQQIHDTMCLRSQGSFLYARLMMDKLLDEMETTSKFVPKSPFETGVSPNALEEALQQLPSSMENMYDEILADHSRRSGISTSVQLKILQLVTHSSRPLRLIEFASMFQFTSGATAELKNKAVLRTACGPLLEILEDETVSIIHHSFTEFLTDESRRERMDKSSFPVIGKLEAHRTLVSACLAYIISMNQSISSENLIWQYYSKMIPPKMALRFPFIEYAISFWHIHARMYDVVDKDIFNALDKLLESNSSVLSLLFKKELSLNGTIDFEDDVEYLNKRKTLVSNIHLAAYGGLSQYCESLLVLGQDPDLRDNKGQTPMIWAAKEGHAGVSRILLKHGAKPDLEGGLGLKPMHYAARSNHTEVVKILLEAGVDPLTPKTREDPGKRCGNASVTQGKTPVEYACIGGCKEAVFEMIPFLSQETLKKALCWTTQYGHVEIVLKILETAPSSVNCYESGDTILFLASKTPNPRIIRALLDNGADPQMTSKDYPRGGRMMSPIEGFANRLTPMHALAGPGGPYHQISIPTRIRNVVESDLTDAFQLLLNAGCSPKEDDGNGYTPLHYAAQSGSLSVAQLLLSHGADVNAKNEDGNTPLHLVISSSLDMAKLLVRNGANINMIHPKTGKTMLHHAMEGMGPESEGLSLLELHPDCNVQDFDGNTALHIACKAAFSHSTSKIFGLLKAGASPNIRNNDWITPMHMLAGKDFKKDLWDFMVQAGGDLELKDTSGNTVLLQTLSGKYDFTNLKNIIELGARPDARNDDGDTVLHLAAYHGLPLEVYDVLIAAGADPMWLNLNNDTILHKACQSNRDKFERTTRGMVLEKILSLGISSNSRNIMGQTALHFAAASVPNTGHNAGEDVMGFFLKLASNCNVNVVDRKGLTALHIAATISEFRVKWLIDAGADITICTPDDQSALHIACRARQSNTVGLLLDEYLTLGRLDMIDHKDINGRTALYNSCRSGRPESFSLLLKAGANPNVKDNNDNEPLFACGEFEEEQKLWFLPNGEESQSLEPKISASGMLLEDHERPHMLSLGQRQTVRMLQDKQSSECLEHYSTRTFESIVLMVDHGVNISSGGDEESQPISNHFTRYVELLERTLPSSLSLEWERLKEFYRVATSVSPSHYQEFREACSPLLNKAMETEAFHLIRSKPSTVRGRSVEKFYDTVADSLKKDEGCFLEHLSRLGYYSVMEKYGSNVHHFDEQYKLNPEGNNSRIFQQPVLHTACQRTLPNLDMIEVLVDKLAVNINALDRGLIYVDHREKYVPDKTALHILAQANHWWQLRGMEFLLQHGADIEAKDRNGKTPLHHAINVKYRNPCWRMDAIRVLLSHGANPNAIDNNGMTCLHMVADNADITRMLMNSGADVSLGSRSLILSAIDCNNIEVVSAYMESGIDINSTLTYPQKQESILARYGNEAQYALHYAATKNRVREEDGTKYISMIKFLLDGGASLYERFADGQVIVHEVFRNRGIIQPFLDLPWLDLDIQDKHGQNLLHIACVLSGDARSSRKDRFVTDVEKSLIEVFLDRGADVSAVDNSGRTALHIFLDNLRQDLRSPKDELQQRTLKAIISSSGSLITAKDSAGFTPMHIALRRQSIWATELLLESGASFTESDPDDNTALHCLSSGLVGYERATEFLSLFKKALDEGVDINAKNKTGATALSIYLSNTPHFDEGDQLPRYFELFKSYGADIFTRDSRGWTLLHVIAQKESDNFSSFMRRKQHEVRCFQFFMGLGLDVDAEDELQRTCLDVAAACENNEILALFKR